MSIISLVSEWVYDKGWIVLVPFAVWNVVGFGRHYSMFRAVYSAEEASKIVLLKEIKAVLIVILSVLIMVLWQIVD